MIFSGLEFMEKSMRGDESTRMCGVASKRGQGTRSWIVESEISWKNNGSEKQKIDVLALMIG